MLTSATAAQPARGRGRPPGGSRRPSIGSIDGADLPPLLPQRLSAKFSAHSANTESPRGAAGGAAGRRPSATSPRDALSTLEHTTAEQDATEGERGGDGSGASSPSPEYLPDVMGIGAALMVVARASTASGKVDGGPWSEGELDMLEQLRHWAPLHDLKRVHAALLVQKDILIKR